MSDHVGATVLVTLGDLERLRGPLQQAAGPDVTLDVELPEPNQVIFAADHGLSELADQVLVATVRLVPKPGCLAGPVDAPTVLAALTRHLALHPAHHPGPDPARPTMALNRLLRATDGGSVTSDLSSYSGAESRVGSAFDPASRRQPLLAQTAALSAIGYSGRRPVTWLGPAPGVSTAARTVSTAARTVSTAAQTVSTAQRPPIVALLDTVIGDHAWLPDSVVDRAPTADGYPMSTGVPPLTPDAFDGTLGAEAGHGTFIAGLIRQGCPDARLLSLPVMGGDGIVDERAVLHALNWLLLRQAAALRSGRGDQLIDVISLSFGYQPQVALTGDRHAVQSADDAGDRFDAQLSHLLRCTLLELGTRGVVVVAAAGNTASSQPVYPAAFAPAPDLKPDVVRLALRHDAVPLLSVGAQNPHRGVALFSNDGPWVTCTRPGVDLVSTTPQRLDGGQPSRSVRVRPRRSGVDPDDFDGGFALWSGTSFSAPVLAAEVAQGLIDGGGLDECDVGAVLERSWRVVTAVTAGALGRPPADLV